MNTSAHPALRAVSVNPNTLHTAAETARILRISTSHLRRWRRDGHGPRCIWFTPRKPVYRAIDIQIFIAECALSQRKSQAAAETFPPRA